MKKLLLVALSLVLIVALFVGCSFNGNNKQVENVNKTKNEAQESKKEEKSTLVMYTNAEFAPYEYFKGEEIVGVDPDIAHEVAKELGKELVIEHTDFDSLIPSLVTEKADFVAAGMTITPEREEEVDFSIPYVESIQNVISKKETDLKSMADLKGKKIGVQLGTTADIALTDAIQSETGELHGSDTIIKPYASALEATQDLLTGRIDAVVIDKLPAEEIVKNNDNTLVASKLGEISESYGIAVKQGNTELLEAINNTLQRLKDEGKIEELTKKHSL